MYGTLKSPRLRRATVDNARETNILTKDCQSIENQRDSFLKKQQAEFTKFLKRSEHRPNSSVSHKISSVHKGETKCTDRTENSFSNKDQEALAVSEDSNPQWLKRNSSSRAQRSTPSGKSNELKSYENNLFVSQLPRKQRASSDITIHSRRRSFEVPKKTQSPEFWAQNSSKLDFGSTPVRSMTDTVEKRRVRFHFESKPTPMPPQLQKTKAPGELVD